MQMAAAAVGKELVPWRRVFQDLCKSGHDHRACVKILEENVGCYYVTPLPKRNNRRPSIMPEPEKVWLCSATIIIVPQNLLSQWHHEIAHHFVQDTFQVLSLDSKEATPMPKGMCSLVSVPQQDCGMLLPRPRSGPKRTLDHCRFYCLWELGYRTLHESESEIENAIHLLTFVAFREVRKSLQEKCGLLICVNSYL